MSQSWIEITLEVDKAEAEDWADALLEAGALSVQAEDADADSPDEQPLFGEPVPPGLPGTGAGYLPQTFGWKRTRLAVLLELYASLLVNVYDRPGQTPFMRWIRDPKQLKRLKQQIRL